MAKFFNPVAPGDTGDYTISMPGDFDRHFQTYNYKEADLIAQTFADFYDYPVTLWLRRKDDRPELLATYAPINKD